MHLPFLTLFAAASLFSASPDSGDSISKRQDMFRTVKSVAVMLPYPDLGMYSTVEVTRTKNRELTVLCSNMLKRHVCEALEKKGLRAVLVADADRSEELSNLSELVFRNLEKHTIDREGSDFFPARVGDFSYSMGSLRNITEKYHVDAVLFLHGFGEMSTVHTAWDGLPNSYETFAGLIANGSGSVLWAYSVWFTDRYQKMSFETDDGIGRALQFLFESDMWGVKWKSQEK